MSLRFNSCGNVDCLCLNHTKAPEYSMSDQRRANAVPLSKLAQSNSKSEDTPNCDCLCHNPDALKWGCEHCAMPPQDTSLDDKHGKYLDDILWLLNPEQVDLTVEEAKHKILNLFSLERAKLFEQIRSEVIGRTTQTFHTESGLSDFADMDLNMTIDDLKRWVSKGIGGHIGNKEFEDFKVKIINRIPSDIIEKGRNELKTEQLEALTRLELGDSNG